MKRFHAAVPYSKFERVAQRLLTTAPAIELTDGSKFVIFSDGHISYGIGDDFNKNRLLMHQALAYYIYNSYKGIYDGDMLELLESRWPRIYAHLPNQTILWQLNLLCRDKLWIIGNHDRKIGKIGHEIFGDIRFVEAVKLTHKGHLVALIMHGHQADAWNSGGLITKGVNWIVRHVWVPLQWLGCVSEPKWSPAKNLQKAIGLAKHYTRLASDWHTIIICGHTHRPAMKKLPNRSAYLNSGSCVKDGAITCLEYEGRQFRSVYWDKEGRHIAMRINAQEESC